MGASLAIILLFLLIPAVVLVSVISLIFKKDKMKKNYILAGIMFAAIFLVVINLLRTGSINQNSIIVLILLVLSLILSLRFINSRKKKH
ncbi:hypothetical protein [Paenibacillus massiliensis]|uniref:hypothetical protein n=1 Tax=Paenibacillus massiliensis TaxID=225917 RepID=UPI00036840D8|nr:hypothetical protein [Paenibacillus massiliensis]